MGAAALHDLDGGGVSEDPRVLGLVDVAASGEAVKLPDEAASASGELVDGEPLQGLLRRRDRGACRRA